MSIIHHKSAGSPPPAPPAGPPAPKPRILQYAIGNNQMTIVDSIDGHLAHGEIVGIFDTLKECREEIIRINILYNDLLLAVEKKFPLETRHQTALRYIRQAERRDESFGVKSEVKND